MKLPTKAAIIAFLGDLMFALTLLAALPYELGAVAQFITPDLKAKVVEIGLFSGIALKLVQRMVERMQGNRDVKNIEVAATTTRGLPPAALLLLCGLCLTACATARPKDPKAVKVPSAYSFGFGLSYGGLGSATVTRDNGKTNFGVGVDAKQVVRLLEQ